MSAVVELRRLIPGAYAVEVEGERVGTVGGAPSLGWQWSSSTGAHGILPRRHATRSGAVSALVEHARRHGGAS